MLRKTNGETIRALREALGITQVSLATRAQVSAPYLCQIELGYQPTMAKAKRIAAALGVSLDAITYTVPDQVA